MKKFLLLATLFTLTSLSQAQAGPYDPIDQFLGRQPFPVAFQAGLSARYDTKMCELSMPCETTPTEAFVVQQGTQTFVQTKDLRDGHVFSQFEVTPQMWSGWLENLFRGVIGFNESFGLKTTLQSIQFSQETLEVEGRPQLIPTIVVHYLADSSMNHVDETATLTSALPGYFQLIRLDSHQSGLIRRHKTVEMKAYLGRH